MKQDRQFRVAMLSVHSCPLGRPGTRDTGGMSIYVQNVARELGVRGLVVDIFTRSHQQELPPMMEIGHNIRLIHIPSGYSKEKLELFPYLPDFAQAVRAFKEQQAIDYNIIHSHYWLSGWVGAELARQWRIPHVIMLHTSARAKNHHLGYRVEPEIRAETEQQVLAAANLVVAATQNEKQELADFYSIDPRKIAVIPCGVDLDTFRPLLKPFARRALNLDGLPVVLYVGRLGPEKGVEQLLEAAAIISRERPIQVVIVGGEDADKGEVQHLQSLSRKLGIAEMTRFHSAVEQDELPLYYSSADVLVLPSQYETFGLVAAEALACGLPVIASPVGAIPQLVQEGKTGFLLESSRPADLATTLVRFIDDEHLRQRLSASARPAVSGLSWSKVAERLVEEYGKLVAMARTRARNI